ncbi:ABC1 family-domain-containing protein [Phycomyces nitens]|nr:ABC1 family-domain-containing protein [Phycomyces nitens]
MIRSRLSRRLSPILVAGVVGTGIYAVDNWTDAKIIQRNLRTAYNGIAVAIDYKWNFQPTIDRDTRPIDELHKRTANRIFDVFEKNGGLYVKMGQVIGTQAAILPLPYQERARRLFDSAPAVPFEAVERVFKEDFGCLPENVFDEFDKTPLASASIAQVHKARLKNGDVVAVKIQKPAIQKQMNSDLFCYRILVQLYEYMFDLPLTWSTDYVESHLRMEADFECEARNALKAWKHIEEEPRLKGKVYIPKIYPEFSSKRVLVCEWIDGVQLTDTARIAERKLDFNWAMETAIKAFSSQIFKTGFVHGDPHPGNVLVRSHPDNPKHTQVVIIDHGLYIQESEKFRIEYCKLWEALFMLDIKTMQEICSGWGIHDANMFASLTLQKPFSPQKAVHLQQNVNMQDVYEMQINAKERIKNFLKDQSLFPREIIFVSRNMNIMRANNRQVGSPVNRINIMARWAVIGLNTSTSKGSWLQTIHLSWKNFVFESTLLLMTITFWAVRFRDALGKIVFGDKLNGFEDVLDKKMTEQLERQFGIKIDSSVFNG